MNIDEFLAEERLLLNDPVDPQNNPIQKYPDATIVQHLTRQVQSLARIQIQRDVGYCNTRWVLNDTDAKSSVQGVWQWPLPTWLANIVSVRILPQGKSATDLTNQPDMWVNAPIRGDPVPKKAKNRDNIGWKFDGNRTFQIWGYGSAPRLFLEVAKLPARLFKAKLDLDGSTTNPQTVYLPTALTLGTEDLVEGAYINAEIQLTSIVNQTNTGGLGTVTRVIYSKANDIVSNARRTKLNLEAALPVVPMKGDVLQSVIPMGDEHTRLLMLNVAWSCFEQLANIPAQKVIQEERAYELKMFIDHISPRDVYEAETWHRPWNQGLPPLDNDRAPRYLV